MIVRDLLRFLCKCTTTLFGKKFWSHERRDIGEREKYIVVAQRFKAMFLFPQYAYTNSFLYITKFLNLFAFC